MGVLVGADGAAKINLGNGLKYVANIISWRVLCSNKPLERTTQADEASRTTGGLSRWSGDFEFHLQFSDDESVALSSWQMLDFAFNAKGDDRKAEIALILQSHQLPPDYDVFSSWIPGVVKLTGTVTLTDVPINCENPEQPIVCVANWEGDGELALVRD
jgi:hypothetical protein